MANNDLTEICGRRDLGPEWNVKYGFKVNFLSHKWRNYRSHVYNDYWAV